MPLDVKNRYTERCIGWRIVVVKDPVCGNVWTNPYDSLSESFKNVFVVILIDSVQREPTLCEQYPWNQRSTQACIHF